MTNATDHENTLLKPVELFYATPPMAFPWFLFCGMLAPVVLGAFFSSVLSIGIMLWAQGQEGTTTLFSAPNAKTYELWITEIPGWLVTIAAMISVLLLIRAKAKQTLPPIFLLCLFIVGLAWYLTIVVLGFNSEQAFP